MANEEVIVRQRDSGGSESFAFDVEVHGGGGRPTTHIVTVGRDYFAKFADAFVSPGELVEASFQFLLSRESKHQILPEFDLPAIQRYFPDFEEAMLG